VQDQHLFLRNDTILGLCEAIGREFGFHPNWLRVALCGAFFFDPVLVTAAYVALAVPVALIRWALPPAAIANEAPAAPEAPKAPAAPAAPAAPPVPSDTAESMSLAA